MMRVVLGIAGAVVVAGVAAAEMVWVAEAYPGRIRAEWTFTQMAELVASPQMTAAREEWARSMAGPLSATTGATPSELAELGGERVTWMIWRRDSTSEFAAGLVLTPTDPDVGSRISLAILAALRESAPATADADHAVIPVGDGPPLCCNATDDGRLVIATEPRALREAADLAAQQPPVGRIWARWRFLPEPILDESAAGGATGALLDALGFGSVRSIDGSLRWDDGRDRFVTRAFVRMEGAPRGLFTILNGEDLDPTTATRFDGHARATVTARFNPDATDQWDARLAAGALRWATGVGAIPGLEPGDTGRCLDGTLSLASSGPGGAGRTIRVGLADPGAVTTALRAAGASEATPGVCELRRATPKLDGSIRFWSVDADALTAGRIPPAGVTPVPSRESRTATDVAGLRMVGRIDAPIVAPRHGLRLARGLVRRLESLGAPGGVQLRRILEQPTERLDGVLPVEARLPAARTAATEVNIRRRPEGFRVTWEGPAPPVLVLPVLIPPQPFPGEPLPPTPTP